MSITCTSSTDTTISLSITGLAAGFYQLERDMTTFITSFNIANPTDTVNVTDIGPLSPSITYTYTVVDVNSTIFTAQTCATTCILPGAKIQTPSGHKLIEDIVAGDMVVDEHGNNVKVIHNIKNGFGPKDVVTIKQGSIGNNLPFEDLEITHGHPIRIPEISGNNGFTKTEHTVESLVDNEQITTEKRGLKCSYTLMTEERIFVMINGIPVCTFAEKEFFEYCESSKKAGQCILYNLQ